MQFIFTKKMTKSTKTWTNLSRLALIRNPLYKFQIAKIRRFGAEVTFFFAKKLRFTSALSVTRSSEAGGRNAILTAIWNWRKLLSK